MKIKKSRFLGFLTLILGLLLWELAALLSSTPFFPTLGRIFESLVVLLTNSETFLHIGVSIIRVYESLVIALVLSVLVGVLQKYIPFVHYLTRILIYPVLQSFPSVSWSFLVAVWFGLSHFSVVFIMCAIIVPHILINVMTGMDNLEKRYEELGKSMGAKGFRMFWIFNLPQLIPSITSALRRAHGIAWKVLPIAEIFSSTAGIGYLLKIAAGYYNVSRILALTLIIIIMVIIVEYVFFDYLDKRYLLRWRHVQDA